MAFVLVGWTGLLVPSLIRSIKEAFAQTDAGIGIFYFVYAVSYATGSFAGGMLTERLGRRTVLTLAAAAHGVGFVLLALAPAWAIFLLAAVPGGLGGGAIDGGGNGLILDLYRSGRGRALNLLHLFFSVGALSAPVVTGRLVEGGVAWDSVLLGSGIAAVVVAALFAGVTMPHGRRESVASASTAVGERTTSGLARLGAPLILLAVAISCYVAAEIGVSNWLVRFLEPAPLSTATLALSLFWAGLALGRLAAARLADRFDHVAFAMTAAGATAVVLVGAILVPSLPVSIALFGLTGFVTGPIFPMIVAIGGDRYPERSAAVSGFLSGAAVIGSIVYPPVMGFLSVTVGLTVAMLGNAVLCLAAVGALALVARSRRQSA